MRLTSTWRLSLLRSSWEEVLQKETYFSRQVGHQHLPHWWQQGAKSIWKSCSQYFLPSNWNRKYRPPWVGDSPRIHHPPEACEAEGHPLAPSTCLRVDTGQAPWPAETRSDSLPPESNETPAHQASPGLGSNPTCRVEENHRPLSSCWKNKFTDSKYSSLF